MRLFTVVEAIATLAPQISRPPLSDLLVPVTDSKVLQTGLETGLETGFGIGLREEGVDGGRERLESHHEAIAIASDKLTWARA